MPGTAPTPPEPALSADPVRSPLRFGFRRRCGWCGVVLRRWQMNMCRRCKARVQDFGIYLQGGGPWCRSQSRWEDEPDPWRWGRHSDGSQVSENLTDESRTDG